MTVAVIAVLNDQSAQFSQFISNVASSPSHVIAHDSYAVITSKQGYNHWDLQDFFDFDSCNESFPAISPTEYRGCQTKTKKKMIILQKETTEHRKPGTSAPQGEPGPPPSVLTPQSPCTVERAVGVGTLYQDTIYASAATTNVTTPFCTGRGGSSIPSGRRRILVQGHPRPPPSHARAAIILQCQIKGNH